MWGNFKKVKRYLDFMSFDFEKELFLSVAMRRAVNIWTDIPMPRVLHNFLKEGLYKSFRIPDLAITLISKSGSRF
jgi:hypothetical protein